MSNRNINQGLYQPSQISTILPPPPNPVTGRSTKNTKFMGIPSY